MKSKAPLLFIVAVISVVGASKAVSTGVEGLTSPWVWVSGVDEDVNERPKATSRSLLEVGEYGENSDTPDSSLNLTTEPRFIGHLKRKLCRLGVGIGCIGGGGRRDRKRQLIEPQDINYVQPLVIQAVGKPIPAVTMQKYQNNKSKVPQRLRKSQETFNKMIKVKNNASNPLEFALSPTALSNSLNLLVNQNKPTASLRVPLSFNPSKHMISSGVPPRTVFKSPRPSPFGSGSQLLLDPFLRITPEMAADHLASNSLTIGSLFAKQPMNLQAANNGRIIKSAPSPTQPSSTPGVFRADLVNSLRNINYIPSKNSLKKHITPSDLISFHRIQSFGHKSQQPQISFNQSNQHSLFSTFNSIPERHENLRSNPGVLSNNNFLGAVNSSPQIGVTNLLNSAAPNRELVDFSTRPKKEVSTFDKANHLQEKGETVIKHIHVHKHIHQIDKAKSSDLSQNLKDNIDSFSTSVFNSAKPNFEPNELENFASNSLRRQKLQRDADALDLISSVKANLGSCTCMAKYDCPTEFNSFVIEESEDLEFVQGPRRNKKDVPVLPSFVESRDFQENDPQRIKLNIEPRKKNVLGEPDYTQTLRKQRKILLNLKKMQKRDLAPRLINNHSKDGLESSEFSIANDKNDETDFSFNGRKVILNLNRLNKRDIAGLVSDDVNEEILSRRQKGPITCAEESHSTSKDRAKRSAQFVRVPEDQTRNDNVLNPSSIVDEFMDSRGHAAAHPRFINTVGSIRSKRPLHISRGRMKSSPPPHFSLHSFEPTVPNMHLPSKALSLLPIHSLPAIHSIPGIQHPLITPDHTFSRLKLFNTPSFLSHPFVTGVRNNGNPLNEIAHSFNIPRFLPPLSPGPLSFYLDLAPESQETGTTKRKRHPIVTDSHDKPKPLYNSTHDTPIGKPHRSTLNPCSHLNCRHLSSYCPARIQRRRPSRQRRRRLHTDKLPFTCGLQEVCCNHHNFGSSFNPVQLVDSFNRPRGCGRSTVTTIKGRISSGSRDRGEAKFGEFPWQAAILKKEGKDSIYVCAASLIDRSHVLTAAHCVEGYAADHLRIRLGEWDVNRDTEFYAHLEYDAVGVAVHPDFYSGNLINDIALVRMLYPVDISNAPHVSPICLPNPQMSFAGSRCWVSGWGKNIFGQEGKYQNLLKKIDIPVIPRRACQDILRETRLGPDYVLDPGMICAGGEPDKDACKGDGGGPLSCRDNDGYFVLSGIVSWGIGCGQTGIPGVYVNVAYYIPWIRQMIES